MKENEYSFRYTFIDEEVEGQKPAVNVEKDSEEQRLCLAQPDAANLGQGPRDAKTNALYLTPHSLCTRSVTC